MTRTVLLRHDLPDGSSHFDWLIARAEPPGPASARTLIAFRTGVRPWDVAHPSFEATRMPDHRVAYLTHEGPLSPGPAGEDRGRVTRVAEGQAEILADAGPSEPLEIEIAFEGTRRRLRGAPRGPDTPDLWVFDDAG